jgi:hypothetical protein
MKESDVGKDSLKGFQPAFDKFSGVSRRHGQHSEIEGDFYEGMTGHFMFHDADFAGGADDAHHLF